MVDGKEVTEPFWNDKKRQFSLVDHYGFAPLYLKIVKETAAGTLEERFNKLCNRGFGDDYKGSDSCAHNIAKAFIETLKTLETKIGTNHEDWQWRNVHVNEYPSHPWSLTKLKPLFHREVSTGGNG